MDYSDQNIIDNRAESRSPLPWGPVPWWSDPRKKQALRQSADEAIVEMSREHLERCYQLEIEK